MVHHGVLTILVDIVAARGIHENASNFALFLVCDNQVGSRDVEAQTGDSGSLDVFNFHLLGHAQADLSHRPQLEILSSILLNTLVARFGHKVELKFLLFHNRQTD